MNRHEATKASLEHWQENLADADKKDIYAQSADKQWRWWLGHCLGFDCALCHYYRPSPRKQPLCWWKDYEGEEQQKPCPLYDRNFSCCCKEWIFGKNAVKEGQLTRDHVLAIITRLEKELEKMEENDA